ncbi:MerR family transcriptional regulator [Neoaquamicrobium sediminum]|uniref:MerR family transcriptional regulator n=1 Tax=Neoaquamicrobium sediminum TaxID=1849104 RepID=UPI0015663F1D|nr:helix-turn-helix domain-containing protein [Mesorhizobium sediminum]NRC52969.1 helix-turn-helix domain-containing protein [Mesorhizobium sediminum]
MGARTYSIGEAAKESGVKVPTIRYYEDIGLLGRIARSDGNRRFYDRSDLSRLSFIRHARELGFEVDAIRTLLRLQDDPDQTCEAADAIAKARLDDVERRISSLKLLRSELKKMMHECAAGRISECRVIEILADSSHHHGRLVEP